jgi:VIT1/CCC1 family predicted Fe2+/Mn2+ transporter
MATPHKKTNNGKSAKHQESFGISEEQLELIITAVKKSMNGSAKHATHTEKNVDLSGYATKYDLLQTKAELKEEMHAMENRIRADNTSNFRWLVGTFIGGMVAFFGAIVTVIPYLIRLLPHL